MIPRPSPVQKSNARNFFSSDNLPGSRSSDEHEFPCSSQPMRDWIRHRQQIARPSPRPVQDYIGQLVFELHDADAPLYDVFDES
jgi:hypothetical protein